MPDHDCEPNDAGTACRDCGAPAEPVSPDELATALTDALNLCNGCDVNTADPNSAAGYCRDCEVSAVR